MTARKKRKSHDPAYAAGVVGIQAEEKSIVAKFALLNPIIPIPLESIIPDIPDIAVALAAAAAAVCVLSAPCLAIRFAMEERVRRMNVGSF